MSESHTVSNSEYWQRRYCEQQDGWDLGKPAPPLAFFFESAHMPMAPARAVVPGCGRGYEVLRLAKLGYHAVGVDFADAAIDAARGAAETQQFETATFVHTDFFHFAAQPENQESFDIAVEHTCYCAIDPKRRDAYLDALLRIMRPGGLFVGLFWACGLAGGPPFTTDRAELENRFLSKLIDGGIEEARDSVSPRAGAEFLLWGYRPPAP